MGRWGGIVSQRKIVIGERTHPNANLVEPGGWGKSHGCAPPTCTASRNQSYASPTIQPADDMMMMVDQVGRESGCP